uniref:Uncharacterized protein n=1 Tax=Timema tahoe TaxID=61484 RepID=A0A7R9IC80_9NEOP|nr:unnamed protein product [Timema tahoe]
MSERANDVQVFRSMKGLKNGQSAGVDEITSEMLKCEGMGTIPVSLGRLKPVFILAHEQELANHLLDCTHKAEFTKIQCFIDNLPTLRIKPGTPGSVASATQYDLLDQIHSKTEDGIPQAETRGTKGRAEPPKPAQLTLGSGGHETSTSINISGGGVTPREAPFVEEFLVRFHFEAHFSPQSPSLLALKSSQRATDP